MPEEAPIACSEVWGGNRVAQMALNLPGITGWIAARPHAGSVAGGDLHYISSCGTGRITRVLLADVAGHGESVAPLAERLRRLMQRYMNHIDPRKLAAALNQDLARIGQSGQFVTAVVVTYFAPSGRLTVCNAGHPKPAIYRAAARRWSLLDQPDTRGEVRVSNLPLGVLEESGYVGRELVLDPGDRVLLYSDCLIESRRPDGTQLQHEGLLEVLNGLNAGETLDREESILEALLTAIAARGHALDDDMTAVILRCTERSAGAAPVRMAAGLARSFLKLFTRDGPWPEWSKANILGPWIQRYQRR